MSHYTEPNDSSARAYAARDDRANANDGTRGGYHWRPDFFRPCSTLIFRASNYAYTYALLETPRDKMLSRLDKFKTRQFIAWNRAVKARRALYSPTYCGQPASVMNLSEKAKVAA